METDFTKLNPILDHTKSGKFELSLNCPHCGDRFSIYVNLNGAQFADGTTWGIIVNGHDWSNTTITPSINSHPSGRLRGNSDCHFSVVNGTCIP